MSSVCFSVWSLQGAITQKACVDKGFWVGDSVTKQMVTVIDTPGLGSQLIKEERMVEDLMDVLKEQIGYVHVFIIVFEQYKFRMNDSIISMLTLMQKTFGEKFWEHAILVASHWNHGWNGIMERAESVPPLTQQLWSDEINKFLKKKFHISKNLPSLFIATFYYKKSKYETLVFQKNLKMLLDFTLGMQRFEMKNIEVDLSENRDIIDERGNLNVNKHDAMILQDYVSEEGSGVSETTTEPNEEEYHYQNEIYMGVIVAVGVIAIILIILVKKKMELKNEEDGKQREMEKMRETLSYCGYSSGEIELAICQIQGSE